MNHSKLSLIALFLAIQGLVSGQEDIGGYPVCISASQYMRGSCCMTPEYKVPCPYDGSDVTLNPGGGGDDNGADNNDGDGTVNPPTGDKNNGEDNNGEDNNGEDNNGEDNNGEDNNGEDNNGEDNNGEDNNGDNDSGDEAVNPPTGDNNNNNNNGDNKNGDNNRDDNNGDSNKEGDTSNLPTGDNKNNGDDTVNPPTGSDNNSDGDKDGNTNNNNNGEDTVNPPNGGEDVGEDSEEEEVVVTDDWQITLTMTSIPPEASLETLTDDTITENTITETTSKGSRETDEPILVPIILPYTGPPVICWNCVKLPGDIQINIPEFCVRIFGLAIGKCPPGHKNTEHGDNDESHGDDSDNNDDDNNNDDHDDNNDNEDDGEDESKDEDPECDAEILPGGIVRRNLKGVSRRQDEGRDSCELGVEYVVYPDSFDSAVTSAVYSYMLTMVTPTGITTEKTIGIGVLYWRAVLTPSQAKDLKGFAGVAFAYQPCKDDCYDPTTEIVMQPNSPDDVVVAGQFPGESLAWYRSNYVYHEQGGRDVELYILDTGANLAHNEFTGGSNIASRARWIHTNPGASTAEDENGGGKKGHGSCMLTRAAGHRFGIAKHVSPIIVRANTVDIDEYISGLARINDDVGEGKRAVLLMSLYWPRTKDGEGETQVPLLEDGDGFDRYPRLRETMLAIFKELTRKGVTIVTGSGNTDARRIPGLPASIGERTADPKNRLDELIVVGATNHYGTARWVVNEGLLGSNRDAARGLPHIYAPGWDVQCTQRTSDPQYDHDKYRDSSGTSPATAATAGLAAYFLSIRDLGPFDGARAESPMALKNYILDLAHNRGGDSSLNLFYNGINPADVKGSHIDAPACPIERRQLKEGDLPDWEDCASQTTLRTTTRQEKPTETSSEDEDDGDDGDDGHDDGFTSSWTCKPAGDNACTCRPNDCDSSDGTKCETRVSKENLKCGKDCSKCDMSIEIDRVETPQSIPHADWSCEPELPGNSGPLARCICRRDCNEHEKGDDSEICFFPIVTGNLGCDYSCGGCDPSSLIKHDDKNNEDVGGKDEDDTWRCRVAYTEDIEEEEYRRWDTCECFRPGCEFGVREGDCMRTISQRGYRCGDRCNDCEGLD